MIGNGQYTADGMTPLTSPANNADELAKRLATMGFQTDLAASLDLGTLGVQFAVANFIASLQPGDTALFYYAGHGIQVNGVNYLWPVDRPLVDQQQVEEEFVSVQTLYDGLKAAKSAVNIIILDACRDNPYAADGWEAGLALPRDTPDSSFIAYATKANDVAIAEDVTSGDRVYSPYTNALLKHIGRTGVPITEIFGDIRNAVDSLTGKVPVVENTLNQIFYFRPPVTMDAKIDIADDEALVVVDGTERMSYRFNGSKTRQLPLHGGENLFSIKIYNHRSFTGGLLPILGGREPKGWNYRAAFTLPGGETKTFDAGEETVDKDGPRHGRLFTAATFTVIVDDETGAVKVGDVDREVWKREGLLEPSTPAGVLPAEVRPHLAWAASNTGPADCEKEYFPYFDCLVTGQNRACLMSYAAERAYEGNQQEALDLVAKTQCHDSAARAAIRHAGADVVSSWLRQHLARQ
ncbi:MAG TPA: caspase family protein [Thermoanaerobaculia bacterium]|nr:caspase family protein [Thermoanaerobaculia bacterium]